MTVQMSGGYRSQLRLGSETTGAHSGAHCPSGAVLGCPEATGVPARPLESFGFSVARGGPEVLGALSKLNVVGSIPITRSIEPTRVRVVSRVPFAVDGRALDHRTRPARPPPAAASVRRRETRPRSRRDASRRRERDRASYLFFRNGAHPGPEHLQLLEPAGPDQPSVPHGHVRTPVAHVLVAVRSEEHTSELQSLR